MKAPKRPVKSNLNVQDGFREDARACLVGKIRRSFQGRIES